ncbi:hypothetical protein [Belnapia rosea]|uniref:Uncharacterized protein n=1 Tax=Belnapia rosea TaxID=938405 RepID=A0A1G7AEI8_9PROT|nr:hypothetical protein [Belnapia rosea]SDE12435.1 hypothetical protein SAMN04487779_101943 [Belnapia rosea]
MIETLHAPARAALTRPRLAILLTGAATAMPGWLRRLGDQRLADGLRPAAGAIGVVMLPAGRPLQRDDMPEDLPFSLRIAAPGPGSWREGLLAAADWVGPKGVVMLAEAGALPAPGWLAAHLAALAGGAEAVVGRLVPPTPAHAYARLLAEIACRLDPLEQAPWPGLDAEAVCNLSLRAALLDHDGPIAGPQALLASLRRRDLRLRSAPAAVVSGMSAPPVPERLVMACRRIRARAMLRRLWDEGVGTVAPETAALRRLARQLGLPAGALAGLLRLRHFGAVWDAVEAASPRLARQAVPPQALAGEHRRARLLLAALRLRPVRGRTEAAPSSAAAWRALHGVTGPIAPGERPVPQPASASADSRWGR